ncbi:energy transducer TonB [Maribacter sp. ANRC-HE7]|uniref:Energy transducer TonB n=1 Tax=Maribacter aquimaris TaxID=2737171 RepID=A0ABR7UX63_9FLAO|nr:energy transducer TonB [Maribacter aquimaris]MBD0777058.1 energy transducer TonB [Maribacter aquimaris]
MQLNRQQLSLLITVFSMAIVVLGLYNIHLGGQQEEDEYVVELVLDEDMLEELIKEEEKMLEELQQQDPIKSHMAFNETAKPSFGNPEPLKTLEEILEEKAMNASDDASEYDGMDSDYVAKVKELAKQREEKKQLLGEREAQKEERTNFLAARRTSVSYSLVDRNNYKLPPPIYTCIEGGKVVINIEVDALGNVTDASFNAKSSGTSNGCLVDNAITYALKAKFDTSSKAVQKGTITYLFQGK